MLVLPVDCVAASICRMCEARAVFWARSLPKTSVASLKDAQVVPSYKAVDMERTENQRAGSIQEILTDLFPLDGLSPESRRYSSSYQSRTDQSTVCFFLVKREN